MPKKAKNLVNSLAKEILKENKIVDEIIKVKKKNIFVAGNKIS
jgi:hypothetical protein